MESKLFLPFSCILLLASFMLPVLSHLQDPHLRPNELSGKDTNPPPLGFLKTIQGSRKGDTVKGVRDLKLYLAHFGYLNYQKNPNVTDYEGDHFDEELEVALKSYQVYYNLNATGVLDMLTVSQMSMRRCGFRDKETHKNTNKYTVSLYQLLPGGPKWPTDKNHLTYGFESLFPTKFMPPVDRAFGKWANASSGYFTFSRAGSYESADLRLSFQNGDHGDGFPFDGPGGVLAHSFAPTDGRLHFDAGESWAVGAVPGAYDVETVATHEIGHLLGLAHSQFHNAIMWATFTPGVTKGLNSDDIEGLSALYGISRTPCVRYNNVIKLVTNICCKN